VVKGLSYTYPGSSAPALDSLNLKIESSEFVLIAGRSACGKSTLAKAICGYLDTEEGRLEGVISYNGRDASEIALHDISGRVAYVQQDPDSQMVTLSVREEVAFGPENLCLPRAEVMKRVEWALDAVKGSHLLHRQVFTLSGGEKQKVAIASMLAMKPSILILDEPTASMDPSSTLHVLDAVQALQHSGMTVIVLEHKCSHFLKMANRLVVMSNGRIAMDIPAGETLTRATELEDLGVRLPGVRIVNPRQAPQNNVRSLAEARRVCLKLGGKRILDNVSLTVGKGEIVAIMGDNGAGKSTMALCMLGLLKPDSGSIRISGRDIRAMQPHKVASRAALVFQNPHHQLFERSVYHEVRFAPSNFGIDMRVKEVKAILSKFSLEGTAHRSPHTLSHGQMKRLNVASVAAYSPMLYILDEALMGQDLDNIKVICSHLASEAARGHAALLILHDPELVIQLCNRVIFMEKGKVIFDEPATEAFCLLRRMGRGSYTKNITEAVK
jgi:energy-coupling factor transport system ATP-binding protein